MFSGLLSAFNLSLKPDTLNCLRIGNASMGNLIADNYPYSNEFNSDTIKDKLYLISSLAKSPIYNSFAANPGLSLANNTCQLVYAYLDDIIKTPAVVKVYCGGDDYIIVYRRKGMLLDDMDNDDELFKLIKLLYKELKETINLMHQIPSDYSIRNYCYNHDMKNALISISPFIILYSIIGKNITDDDEINKIIETVNEVDNGMEKDLMLEIAKSIKKYNLKDILEFGSLNRIIRDYSLKVNTEKK